MTGDTVPESLSLLDWRRTVGDLYAEIRGASDNYTAWRSWRAVRSRLHREHPQSPLPAEERGEYTGPHLFDYDPSWCLTATVEATEPRRLQITTSTVDTMAFARFGVARFAHAGAELSLELYWLEGYGGGLFLPFADATSGQETYGAGRYLLDSVKGADLGARDGRLVLDFNFAYQPSCAYDPRWTCPLTPPANRLSVAVRAGERVSPV
ncbi:MAG: DUF1684 domain-containing protein [Solirubrobacterales bacterium]|nr:DUF1684 domain-containing protein [Solirubrobacterales bacterium]